MRGGSAAGPEALQIGRVLGLSARLILRNARAFGVLALVAFAPAIAVRIGVAVQVSSGAFFQDDGSPRLGGFAAYVGLALLGEALVAALVVHGARDGVGDGSGRVTIGAWSMARRGLERIGPALVTGALRLVALAIVAAFPFLAAVCAGVVSDDPTWFAVVVLGVSLFAGVLLAMLVARLWVAVPVVVMEDVSPFGALDRSALLTDGVRWRVVAVVAVIEAVGWATRGVLAGLKEAVATDAAFVAYVALDLAAVMAIATWSGVAIAVGYHELRRTREGVRAVDVSTVFE